MKIHEERIIKKMVSLLVETIHTKTRFAFFISTVLQGNNHLFALMLLPCRTFAFCYHTTLRSAFDYET